MGVVCFELLVEKHEAVSIPPHRLDAITSLVDEQEEMSIKHADFKHRCNHTCESIKALSKIYRLRTKVNRQMRGTRQHVGKRPGNPFLPGSVVLSPVNSGLWAFSGEVSYERAGAGLA